MADLRRRALRGARARATEGGGQTLLADDRSIGGGPSERCGASGWRLRVACTDGTGTAVCPLCGQRVAARPDASAGGQVRVIQEHGHVIGGGHGRSER